jgi:methionyl-tRNA formyltransferase
LSPIRWDRPAVTVHNQIRGLQPWPGAVTFLGEQLLKVTASVPCSYRSGFAAAGTILEAGDLGIRVACGEGELRVTALQVPGRSSMPVADFLRGHRVRVGDVFVS